MKADLILKNYEIAKERAEEEMRQHHSQMEYHHSQANLARAMERLRVVKRYPR